MGKWKEVKWGRIPNHWNTTKIKEGADIVTDYVANGSFASLAANVKYKEEEDYAVLIRLVDYNNNFKGSFVFIDKHAYDYLKKSQLFGGEIIISNVGANVGTVFKCPYLNYKMSLAPNSIMVKFKGVTEFYYYWLKSPFGQFSLQSIVTGSAQPKFNKTNFKDLEIPVPPFEEQQKIANILSSLDDKIEVNRRINEQLEELAQALFKSWFVDFEPFKDDEFVESELGIIPKGWKVGKLGDVANISSGKRPPMKQSEMSEEINIPLIGASSVMGFTNDILYNKPILVIGRVGTHGIVQRFNTPCWPSDNTLVIESTNYEYVYQILKTIDYKSLNRGSTQPLITQTDVKNQVILIPNETILSDYNKIVSKIMDKYNNNLSEITHLTNLRDTLLPKLMSGEIDVNEVEI